MRSPLAEVTSQVSAGWCGIHARASHHAHSSRLSTLSLRCLSVRVWSCSCTAMCTSQSAYCLRYFRRLGLFQIRRDPLPPREGKLGALAMFAQLFRARTRMH